MPTEGAGLPAHLKNQELAKSAVCLPAMPHEERKKLGLSQEALGEKLGVSRQAISKWESDASVPEIDKLIVLSKLFSVSVGWLLGVEEDWSRL